MAIGALRQMLLLSCVWIVSGNIILIRTVALHLMRIYTHIYSNQSHNLSVTQIIHIIFSCDVSILIFWLCVYDKTCTNTFYLMWIVVLDSVIIYPSQKEDHLLSSRWPSSRNIGSKHPVRLVASGISLAVSFLCSGKACRAGSVKDWTCWQSPTKLQTYGIIKIRRDGGWWDGRAVR